ncbi:MAG TPA: SH3 domain-containing protein [Sphingopyxis sp.]|nr:SH3 domain-containing protein [Sphingopyxis sp.]HMQ20076.1 SH3 domain-containing protein [Sphingopyxis sp.]
MRKSLGIVTVAALLSGTIAPAAAKEEPIALTRCEASYGTIAVVDGDTQGWSQYGLGSPRELINALAIESGCFTPHSPASGAPADFLMNVIAGDSEEVDKSIEVAKSAAVEGLVRSGAAGSVISRVPIGGALFGAFGGLGGKKKRVAAGIKLISPANGQTVVAGSGEVRKSTLTFGGGNAWTAGANASGYAATKDGKMLAEAFVKAFNSVSGQGAVIAAMPRPQPVLAAAPAAPEATVAVDTVMRAEPSGEAASVRMLRAGTDLTPTGQRNGLFIEVKDGYGTQGWVSVEDLG